jgi:hypothetical protein
MKKYNAFLKFHTRWLSAKLWLSQHKLKCSIISTQTRIILILENMMICILYVFILFCDRTNYWIGHTGYWIKRVSYKILKPIYGNQHNC